MTMRKNKLIDNKYPPILKELGEIKKTMGNDRCVLINEIYFFLCNKELELWDLNIFKMVYNNSAIKNYLITYYKDNITLILNNEKLYFFDVKTYKLTFFRKIEHKIYGIIMVASDILLLCAKHKLYLLNIEKNEISSFKYMEEKEEMNYKNLVLLYGNLILICWSLLWIVVDWKKKIVVNVVFFGKISVIDKRNGRIFPFHSPFIPIKDEKDLFIIHTYGSRFADVFDFVCYRTIFNLMGQKFNYNNNSYRAIGNSDYYIRNMICGVMIYDSKTKEPISRFLIEHGCGKFTICGSKFLILYENGTYNFCKILRNRL